MYNWIDALADLQNRGEPCVLVTIIEELGSTPRNAGSKMVISAKQTFDTIGGGHLEYKAMQIARDMLASLPCRVRWIDSRDAEFPEHIPHGVRKIVSEDPVDEIDDLPAGSYCIVMTHNHQLDLELTAAILKRNDFAYFGLIGSKTKRVKFEHRLRDRGFDTSTVQRMRCPMTMPRQRAVSRVQLAIFWTLLPQMASRRHCLAPVQAALPPTTCWPCFPVPLPSRPKIRLGFARCSIAWRRWSQIARN